MVPAETFVSEMFVAVMLTTFKVPAMFILPDKLMDPPVIVDADNAKVPTLVATIEPEEILVFEK